MASVAARLPDSQDSPAFAAMLNQSFEDAPPTFEGAVVSGTVVAVDKEFALIDVGLKAEGRVPVADFAKGDEETDIRPGDVVDVFVERMEDKNGEAVLSREKARREEAWQVLEKACAGREQVTGQIFNKIKGGFMVDLGGAVAFLPGSQVDIRPVRDVTPIMHTPQPFHILKMDRSWGNIVVSRRTVLEETQGETRAEILDQIAEGQIIKGVVKNLTDYGAFVDLGGVDGLLHVTDMSWGRVGHPSDVLSVGQTLEVQVIRYNASNGRISLGTKQLEADPWDAVPVKYPSGTRLPGRVTNVTEYGAFVELEPGVEGLVHVSEMSWTKKNVDAGKVVAESQEVEVMVLEVDMDKRRISLGLKQCQDNPWATFAAAHKVGDTLEGPVQNITEFGLFVGLAGDIDGMVHLSDLAWDKSGEEALQDYEKGQVVQVKVLGVDTEAERVALGIKQLTKAPASAALSSTSDAPKKGAVVTCTVAEVTDGGIAITIGDGGARGFIKRADLSRERSEQRPNRFAVGEKVDAKVLSIKKDGEVNLSIKAREVDEDKAAMAAFGSTESGASLGDILGAALKDKEEQEPKADQATKTATKAKARAKGAAESKADDGGSRTPEDGLQTGGAEPEKA
ncbi:MAG TPA: 30S ribosomal protein S1 [Rhodospirillaceae bacterium]|jgi:small subunit ribosomal protein S1|nr:30S ribosomal protein S1 [Alphaproteobacteria bacterium]HBH26713.1 30S ribosomal protein S1 [Rhodospirillaceae bacterium]